MCNSSSDSEAPQCAYCGLPLAPAAAGPEVQFCCFGCRFASAVTAETGAEGQARWTLTRLGLSVFFTMGAMMFSMALWSQELDGAQDATAQALFDLYRYACLLFASPVLVMLGFPLFENAVHRARQGQITTDLLLALGVAAAFVYSLQSVWTGSGHVYFEVTCSVLVAVTLGRWLEATGKLKTTEALRSLERLLPESVIRIDDGREDRVPLASIRIGDLIRVRPGERIPCDGTIERNSAAIDEQLVTGEGEPRVKGPGDATFSGTLNIDGELFVRVTTESEDSTVSKLVSAVTRAALRRGVQLRLADRIAAGFVPVVFLAASLTFAFHRPHVGPADAMMIALAVVVIACPCALGIATPLALWSALGNASRHQVLFRDGDALTKLAGVRTICFDKTGTLTTGKPAVEVFHADSDDPEDKVLCAAGTLAATSSHAFSEAIATFAASDRIVGGAAGLSTSPGRGVSAEIQGYTGRVYLGSRQFMEEAGLQAGEQLLAATAKAHARGTPTVLVGWAGRVRGVFVLVEELRDSTQGAIERLRQMGIRMTVLTGDPTVRVGSVVSQLQVAVHSGLLPEEKQQRIEELRAGGGIAMVGDGINDTPALLVADVGIALGSGADVSREAAEVCLLTDDLSQLAWAIELARRTRRVIRQNLFWAFGYNVVGMALASAGWLNPILAALAMVGSSLFVVTNSMRLAEFQVLPSSASTEMQPPGSARPNRIAQAVQGPQATDLQPAGRA